MSRGASSLELIVQARVGTEGVAADRRGEQSLLDSYQYSTLQHISFIYKFIQNSKRITLLSSSRLKIYKASASGKLSSKQICHASVRKLTFMEDPAIF